MCNICCEDNRFELIAKAKKEILESTNITDSPKEMEVLDNFLFRCWQMGWLQPKEEWQNYKLNLPHEGVEVLTFNPKWIDEDFNPKGIRIGFLNDGEFITCIWDNELDSYMDAKEEPLYWKEIKEYTN